MTLSSPWVLLLLIPTALFAGWAHWRALRRRAALRSYLDAYPKGGFWPPSPTGPSKPEATGRGWAPRAFAGLFLILSLAGVTVGTREVPSTQATSPVILLVDISASMGVEDVPWGRLGASKILLRRLAPELGGVPVGLTVFSEEVYPLVPPTVDLDLLFTYLDALDPSMVTGRGTSIDAVLDEAVELASLAPSSAGPTFVLISDGEDESLLSEGVESAQRIQMAGGRLAALVAGTGDGGTVPAHLLSGAVGAVGGNSPGQGSTANISRADEERMARLAEAGGGPLLSVAEPGDLRSFARWLGGGATPPGPSDPATVPQPVDRWPWLTALALGALLLGSGPRRSRILATVEGHR